MSPADILSACASEGVRLALSPAATRKASGECAAALNYFLGRAREAAPAATDDERRTCAQCSQLNSRGARRSNTFVPKSKGYES